MEKGLVIRILVTGDRNWGDQLDDRTLLWGELDGWLSFGVSIEIIEGCARGADTMAEEWARNRHQELSHFPADWKTYGRAAGPIRNKAMLDYGPDIVLAFHHDITRSKGTANMIGIARVAGVPTKVFG